MDSSRELSSSTGVKLDTSGAVYVPPRTDQGRTATWRCEWDQLSPFAQGYVEAMFASLPDEEFWQGGFGFSDLAPETLAAILKDCAQAEEGFVRPADMPETGHAAGGQFWRGRNEHKPSVVRAPIESGLKLTLKYFPPLAPYLGDDGKVYLREAGQ